MHKTRVTERRVIELFDDQVKAGLRQDSGRTPAGLRQDFGRTYRIDNESSGTCLKTPQFTYDIQNFLWQNNPSAIALVVRSSVDLVVLLKGSRLRFWTLCCAPKLRCLMLVEVRRTLQVLITSDGSLDKLCK